MANFSLPFFVKIAFPLVFKFLQNPEFLCSNKCTWHGILVYKMFCSIVLMKNLILEAEIQICMAMCEN